MSLQLKAVSPAALGLGNNNDYAGLGNASFARLSTNAGGSTLTGATGGTDGRFLIILNLTAGALTINHQDANSAAANQFFTSTGIAIVLAQDDTALFVYDATTTKWRQITGVV